MKSLGVMFAAVLLAVPFVGAAGNDEVQAIFENEHFLKSIEIYEQNTGNQVDLSQVQVLAEDHFKLPAGAGGVQATFNYATNALEVVPLTTAPDLAPPGDSACYLMGGTLFGYEVPALIGACTPTPGPGLASPVTQSQLICYQNQFCLTEAFGGFGLVELYCQINTLTYAIKDWTTGAPPTVTGGGVCFTFAFVFGGGGTYNTFVYGSPTTGITVSATN